MSDLNDTETRLSEPKFIETDPKIILDACIADWESRSGKKLYPAQVDQLFIDFIAYRESLVRIGVQEAAKQNLVAFARYPMLDYLGEFYGVTRLVAQAAVTTVQFSVTETQSADIYIPIGTRISDSSSTVSFITIEETTISVGSLNSAIINVQSENPGAADNVWKARQLNTLIDLIGDYDVSVTNTTQASGGSDEEDDDHLRERIKLAPESFTTAGSIGSYRFHTLSVSSEIIDVGITSTVPGTVNLFILLRNGLADDAFIKKVSDYVSSEKLRPLCDTVIVKNPLKVEFEIRANITLYTTADVLAIKKRLDLAAQNYADLMSSKLGIDLVPVQLESALKMAEVYDIELLNFPKIILENNHWAYCKNISINIVGSENG